MGSGAAAAATTLSTPTAMPSSTAEPDKEFKCPVCARIFNKKANLKVHSRKHTGEKPYACSKPGCGRAFMWKSSVTFHEQNCPSTKRDNSATSNSSTHPNSSSPNQTPSVATKGVQKRPKSRTSHPNAAEPHNSRTSPKAGSTRRTPKRDHKTSRTTPTRTARPATIPQPSVQPSPPIRMPHQPNNNPHNQQQQQQQQQPTVSDPLPSPSHKRDHVLTPPVRSDEVTTTTTPSLTITAALSPFPPSSRSLPSQFTRSVRSPGIEMVPSIFSPPVGVTPPPILAESLVSPPPPPDGGQLPAPASLLAEKRQFAGGGRPPVIPGSLPKHFYASIPKDNAGPKALFDLRVPAAPSSGASGNKPPVMYNNRMMPKIPIAMELDDSDDEGANKVIGAQEAFMRSGDPFVGFAPPTRCSPLPASSPIVCPGISPMPLSPLAPFSPLPPDSPAHNAPNPVHPPLNQPNHRHNSNW